LSQNGRWAWVLGDESGQTGTNPCENRILPEKNHDAAKTKVLLLRAPQLMLDLFPNTPRWSRSNGTSGPFTRRIATDIVGARRELLRLGGTFANGDRGESMRVSKKNSGRILLVGLMVGLMGTVQASTSKDAQGKLETLLLGKDVRALVDLPAYKEGVDVYYLAPSNKRADDRGVDLGELTKWLKAKGVGVERDEWVTITNVKIDSDKVEIHLEGGGEGRRGSNHANKVGASYKRAGGSRLNLKYQKDLIDNDIAPDNILRFMSRMLDVSRIEQKLVEKEMPQDLRAAIEAHTVVENMTYEMVLMSFGDPDQKKVDESDSTNLKETWFYLKNGHRWVVHFENGKVAKTQVF
jgi:hypothetical protein